MVTLPNITTTCKRKVLNWVLLWGKCSIHCDYESLHTLLMYSWQNPLLIALYTFFTILLRKASAIWMKSCWGFDVLGIQVSDSIIELGANQCHKRKLMWWWNTTQYCHKFRHNNILNRAIPDSLKCCKPMYGTPVIYSFLEIPISATESLLPIIKYR